jgi:predicted Fe-S protein YdhL (DUF1289 family)
MRGTALLIARPEMTPARVPAAGSAGVASPCVSVCTMNPRTGYCDGCLRTIDEIAHWGLYDEAEKRAVWAQLSLRRQQLGPARGAAVP